MATREAEEPEAEQALEENVGVREQGGEMRCSRRKGEERRDWEIPYEESQSSSPTKPAALRLIIF